MTVNQENYTCPDVADLADVPALTKEGISYIITQMKNKKNPGENAIVAE